ncbi:MULTISPECIES: Zn-ribbon domain-containing OB-fold protein [Nocardia]|uniref:Zn-ribbon domain-containing OB-fold protein n=1 Tax=Nocardia TaxID=1817 RepID=UPI000D697964|nr:MULTISPECIES: OB-fold domain-containing protein [Nocardia]
MSDDAAAVLELPWGPAEDGLDQPYWDGLRAGELRLQRCTRCREWIWGPQWICGHCHTFDPGWEPVDPVGTVYSWSRSHYPFITELAERVPYVTVLVALPNAGNRRVLGILTGEDTDRVRIGDPVTGHIELDEGATWPLLRWRRGAARGEQV